MKRLITFVLLIIGTAVPLRAADLQILGGYLDVGTANGRLFLVGDRQFTFRGHVANIAGIFKPGDCNSGGVVCTPGAVIQLDAAWSGLDLPGDATLDGNTYPNVGSGTSSSSMEVLFSGSAVLPALGPASTTVSVPFALSGRFSHPGGMETLHGLGTATLFLSPHPLIPGVWHVDRVLYRLASTLLPPPWGSTDIGVVGTIGFTGYVDGTFYVQGDGGDIWSTADAFRFVYQPVAGDADIIARVTDEQAADPFAKAGVMFRQSLDPSSLQVILDRKPSGALEFMTRLSTGDSTTYITGASSATPTWLRITRSGSQFTAFQSADGTTWSEVGSISVPSAGFNLLAGLAVTSHDSTVLNTSVFDQVTVTMPVSVHNLLQSGDFEDYVPPTLGPPGWMSDSLRRQVPAKSETHQPHSGRQNGACWTPEFLDCGLFQEVIAPVTGAYTLRLFAAADRPGGLVGASLNGQTATLQEVTVRNFGDYAEYTMPFSAHVGDAIAVWMYSPPTPGYVVIDDVSLTLDQPIAITQGTWTIGLPGSALGQFRLAGTDVQINGTYDGGFVEPFTDCSTETPCVAGQLVALRSGFENQTVQTIESFARGSAMVGGVPYPFLEFGGALVLAGQTVAIPTPMGTDFPELVEVRAPFTFSGDLRGFEVIDPAGGMPFRDPHLKFDLPMTGHGTATLGLLTAPSSPGPVLTFYRLTYTFEP